MRRKPTASEIAARAGDPAAIEQAVQAANRSSLDPRETRLSAVPDLSRSAIAERRTNESFTGRQLIGRAASVFDEAKRLQKVALGRSGSRAQRASDKADDALRVAATQIRLAQLVPLDRGYLHALSLDRVQTVKAEVVRAFDTDPAALAVDTHRRIQDQRNRVRAERTQ